MGVRNSLMHRAVFLDRDGVLNRAPIRKGRPYTPNSVSELEVLPGVPEALDRLREAGFRLIVVTNQPDVARGTQRREAVEAINSALSVQLGINDFRVCYHDDGDGCNCRKPAPGLLLAAAQEGQLDLSSCFMIGDRWRDIEAGRRVGCATIFIDYGYDEKQPTDFHVRVQSLAEAADYICIMKGMNQ